MPPELSHIDASGTARMVDVSDKPETKRTATARGHVAMKAETRRLVAERALPKGDVFTVARIAGVLSAKRTGELIPLCHPLPLTDVQVDLTLDDTGVEIVASAACFGRTGIEMEALTAVTVAALTVYDMCKAADKGMVIGPVHLLAKTGGRSGDFRWQGEPPPAPNNGGAGGTAGAGRDALPSSPPIIGGRGGL